MSAEDDARAMILKRILSIVYALGLAACSGLPRDAVPPGVSVAEVEIAQLGLFEQRFDVGLRLSNPNTFELAIEAVEFDLELNGRPFARSVSRTGTRIPAGASAVMQVDAVTQSSSLVEQFRALSPEILKGGVPYRIKGRVRIERAARWLPFDHSGTYGGPAQKPRGRAI